MVLILNFPRILKLLESMQRRLDESAVKKKIDEDISEIARAFDEKNADNLNAIFANESVVRDDTEANKG